MIDDNKFDISHTRLTSQDIWSNKGKWYEESKNSQDYWDNEMNADEKDALIKIVRRSIERFYDTVETWLPEALVQKGGEYIEVRFGVLLTDIDREIDQSEEATSFQLKEAQADIKNMINDYIDNELGEK